MYFVQVVNIVNNCEWLWALQQRALCECLQVIIIMQNTANFRWQKSCFLQWHSDKSPVCTDTAGGIQELPPCRDPATRVTCTSWWHGWGRWWLESCLPAATQQGEWPALTLWGGGRGDERVASLQQHGEQSDPHLVTQQVGGKWQESCLPTATQWEEWPTLTNTTGRGRC